MGKAMNLNKQISIAVRRFLRRTEGASAVEVALCGSVLFLCLCGVVDFGNIYLNWHMVNEEAREGARLAAISTAVGGLGTSQSAVQTAIRTKYKNNNLILTMNPNPLPSGPPQKITVQVSQTVSIINPMIKPFFNSNPVLSGQCTMLSQ
ncbi:MAG: pilus assembly protein [Deltaproteobacteria bacterium]|nr:pilus assembly protein [Deltaproteobacteria bacterium]